MWDYSEKDIERFFLKRKRFFIGKKGFQIITNQFHVTIPQSVTQNNIQQTKLHFKEAGEKILPIIDGIERIPDLLAYKTPKNCPIEKSELRVIEIKKNVASLSDVAQLNQYVNILKFLVKYNIDDINSKLRITRNYNVKGFLFARGIPVDVWCSANRLFKEKNKKEDSIDLIGYEIESKSIKKGIRNIKIINFSQKYKSMLNRNIKQYKKLILVDIK